MAFFSTCAALALALAQTTFAQNSTCQSYGVDYQDGGSYFQNSDSNTTFSAYQQFSGCSNDTAHNVIVDPNGDQSECSSTSMQPSDTDLLVTCGNWTQNNMYSGDWSILVISNNGEGNSTPIAYQRDFSLSVGPATATVSSPPMVTSTVSETTTSTVVTSTAVATSTLLGSSNSSTTSASSSSSDSTASSASASSTDSSASASTLTGSGNSSASASSTSGSGNSSSPVATITSFATVTSILTQDGASCSATSSAPASASATATASSSRFRCPDQGAKFAPTVLGKALHDLAASIISKLENGTSHKPRSPPVPASAKFRRAILEGQTIDEELKRAFVKERAAHLHGENAIAKRHPDSPTSTIYTGTITSTTYTTETATETTYVASTSTSLDLGSLFGRDAGSTTTVTLLTTITEVVCPTS